MKRGSVFFLMAVTSTWAQDPPVVFRSDVSLVRVDVQVQDSSSRAITGLTRADFVLHEHGQVREIRNFANENLPVDVLMWLWMWCCRPTGQRWCPLMWLSMCMCLHNLVPQCWWLSLVV